MATEKTVARIRALCASDKPSFGLLPIASDGSDQMQYLKRRMESVDFIHGQPMDSVMLLYCQKERNHRVSVFAWPDYIFAYACSGEKYLLDFLTNQGMTLDAWWMDPCNEAMSYIKIIRNMEKLASPFPRKGISTDWMLVLKKAEEQGGGFERVC